MATGAWVDKYLAAHGARLEADLGIRIGKKLGCGTFGCAFLVKHGRATRVLKLTVDRDEPKLWVRPLELIEAGKVRPGGLCEVDEVGLLSTEVGVSARLHDFAEVGLIPQAHRKNPDTPAFAILRAEVHPFLKDHSNRPSPAAEDVIERHGSRTWGLFSRTIDYLYVVGRLWNELHWASRGEIAELLPLVHRFAHEQVRADIRDLRTLPQVDAELGRWIATLRRVPYATDLATTLEDCHRAGIVFADLKLDNLGFRSGTGPTRRQAVIFDVGGTPVARRA